MIKIADIVITPAKVACFFLSLDENLCCESGLQYIRTTSFQVKATTVANVIDKNNANTVTIILPNSPIY